MSEAPIRPFRFLSTCLGSLILSLALLPSALPADDARGEEARAILDAWHAENPMKETRYLRVIYWHPTDRAPNEDYRGRLKRIMEDIQAFYAKEMARLGFGPRSFNLPYDEAGELVIHVVEGKGKFADYGMPDGSKVRSECLPSLRAAGIDPDNETLLIFTNLADWDPAKLIFRHKAPYYASGDYRAGNAWQLDSPELDIPNLSLKEPVISDGQYGRISLGKHNSIFIGGIAHELGHGLGLPHGKARPDEATRGTALMGSGNRAYGDELRNEGRGAFITMAHALRLASHPQFSGSAKGMDLLPKSALNKLELSVEGKAIRVSGNVVADPPAYGIVAYTDPDGGGDYDATTYSTVPDENGDFSLSCDALEAGKSGELRLFVLHANGAVSGRMSQTPYRHPYSVTAEGTPDLSLIHTRRMLSPLIEALGKKDRVAADAALKTITGNREASEHVRVIAKRLREAALGEKPGAAVRPSEVGENETRVSLADTKPQSVTTGWGGAAFNHVPDQGLLLSCGGDLFETGIYAHAPAIHRYELGGKWKRFQTKAGLAEGHPGSVVFIIEVDGKEVARTRPTKSGELRDLDIGLSGAQVITLKTDPTPDGSGGDWGFWFDPVLSR